MLTRLQAKAWKQGQGLKTQGQNLKGQGHTFKAKSIQFGLKAKATSLVLTRMLMYEHRKKITATKHRVAPVIHM